MGEHSPDSAIATPDVATLTNQLQDIYQRLQGLMGDEVDAVIGPTGQSYLLQHAQTQLLEAERRQGVLAQQLRAEHSKLVAAQAVAKIGSWSFDVASTAFEWSEEMHRIHQTDPKRFQPTFASLLESASIPMTVPHSARLSFIRWDTISRACSSIGCCCRGG